jgi:hypothetical protein
MEFPVGCEEPVTSGFSKFEEFARLAQRDGIDVRPTLLRVLTDFYVQKPTHTADEDQHFIALAARLIEEVDPQTREAVRAKLLAHGAAPAAILGKLGVDQNAPAATEAPGRVGHRPEQVSDQDKAAAARFSDIFFNANSDERRAILRELDAGATAPPLAIPADEAGVARQRLEIAALRGRPFEFVRELERVLHVPQHYAEAIIKDASGEPMLVIAKALTMPIDVVQRILLLVNPLIGNSVRRVFDLCALYEELSPQAALRLVSLWRHAAATRPAVHLPVQWPHQPGDPRETASAASPAAGVTDRKHQRAS